jgi:hypothetical protein
LQRRAFVGRQAKRDAEPSDRRRKVRAFVEFSRKLSGKTAVRPAERAGERKSRRKRYRLKTFDGGASRRFFSAKVGERQKTNRRAVGCLILRKRGAKSRFLFVCTRENRKKRRFS